MEGEMRLMGCKIFLLSAAVCFVSSVMLDSRSGFSGQGKNTTGGYDSSYPSKREKGFEIDVYGPSRDLYRIAVVPPRGTPSGEKQVSEVLTRDLKLSSLFKVLNPDSFLEDKNQPSDSISVEAWSMIGAQGVIKGNVEIVGTRFNLELYLFEVVRGTKPVLRGSYSGKLPKLRGKVHSFVNQVIKYFTGVAGVFGSRILFARKTGKHRKDIFTVGMDGHGLAKITDNGSINIIPSWGPGGVVFYTSFITGYPFLYRSDRVEPVFRGEGVNMGAAIAAGGGKMAVVLAVDGQPDIFLADIDGKIIKRLTNSPAIDVSPAWAPGGGKIAFVSDREGSPQIYVMGTGGGARRVTFRGSYNTEPCWCPRCDEPQIVFSGRDGGNYDIFTVRVSTGEMKRLTEGEGSNKSPAWSPDGRLIAFYSSRGGIYLMNTDGLNQNLILRGHAETLRWR